MINLLHNRSNIMLLFRIHREKNIDEDFNPRRFAYGRKRSSTSSQTTLIYLELSFSILIEHEHFLDMFSNPEKKDERSPRRTIQWLFDLHRDIASLDWNPRTDRKSSRRKLVEKLIVVFHQGVLESKREIIPSEKNFPSYSSNHFSLKKFEQFIGIFLQITLNFFCIFHQWWTMFRWIEPMLETTRPFPSRENHPLLTIDFSKTWKACS